MPKNSIKLSFAQLNLTVGDIKSNTEKIISSIYSAENEHKADIILFPELTICSYPPEDLLLRPAFYQYIESALTKITRSTKNIHALIGYPHKQDDKIFNACCLINNGKIKYTYYKQHLPNYGVFDEKRYFTEGENEKITFELNGTRCAVNICEDIWVREPIKNAAKNGATVLFNLNASPYHKDRISERKELLAKQAKDNNIHIAYANLVGGQDELVFDGNSMLFNNQGELHFQAPQLVEGLFQAEINLTPVSEKQTFIETKISTEQSIYQALVVGVKDYIKKNNFKGVLIGLSGGIDSALTASIAVDAIGSENVEVLIMPSRYTAQMSIDDAIEQAQRQKVQSHVVSIEPCFESFLSSLEERFAGLPQDLTEENIQARCRGILLMAVSNKTGKLVLTTGNKSEMAVGYATLYGDMCGGFAPLKDVWKTMVYRLAKWRNTQGLVIPENVIMRPPSAELRDNQLDQDSLPDYDMLDAILERYIEQDQSPERIIADGYDKLTVEKLVKLVDINEYKRRQSAPGVRITERAFGRDRRYPITSGYLEK